MPQVKLEYSANVTEPVDFTALFTTVHDVLVEVGGMRRGNCKSRAVRHETYHVGDGAAEKAFVHVEVRFLEGRPADTKQPVGREILRILQDHYRPSLERLDLQITVEVGEIARRLYFKIPEGTLSQPEDRHAYA